MGHSTVMLSAAKHLSAQHDRPFAALRVTVEGPIDDSVGKLVSQAQMGMTFTLKASIDLEFPNRVIDRHLRMAGSICSCALCSIVEDIS
jgi:hypothetical protein